MGIRKTKIFVILIIFILLISIQCNVHASMLENMWKDASDFVKLGKDSDINTFNGEQMQKSTDSLYIMFWWAGVGIAAIVGAYLGIKFMTEGIEGKAKIKEALVPYCIGCVIIFGAFGVWRIAMQLFGDLEEAEENSVRDTHFHQEKCAEGNHSYSTFKDTVCTYCGYKCEHQMNGPYSDGSMICNKAGCKFKITNCESTYNGRTKQSKS